MSVRRLTVAGLVLTAVAGCSPTEQKEKAGPMPWEKALAKDAPANPTPEAPVVEEVKVAKESQPPLTAEGLRTRSRRLANEGNFTGALQAAEESLKKEPASREGLFLVAALCQARASEPAEKVDAKKLRPLFLRSGETARALKKQVGDKLRPQEQGIIWQAIYNEACAYALDGRHDKALASLKEVYLELGEPRNFDDLDKDTDLVSLRPLPAFADLREKVQVKKEEAQKLMEAAEKEQAQQALAANKPFDFAFTLPNLEGEPVSLASYDGKVRIVDVWATWCPPCRAEVPHFVALQKKYGDKGLQILGINYEKEDLSAKEVKKTIQDFAERIEINYPCLIGDDETRLKIPEFNAYPTTIFIDRAGKVRAKTVGYKPLATIETIVKTLLAENSENASEKTRSSEDAPRPEPASDGPRNP